VGNDRDGNKDGIRKFAGEMLGADVGGGEG